jgi:histidine ammonia-lyase
VLDEDRPLGPDIDRIQAAIAAGVFGPDAAAELSA